MLPLMTRTLDLGLKDDNSSPGCQGLQPLRVFGNDRRLTEAGIRLGSMLN